MPVKEGAPCTLLIIYEMWCSKTIDFYQNSHLKNPAGIKYFPFPAATQLDHT